MKPTAALLTRIASNQSPARLLCYTVKGSQPQYLTHDIPNPHYYCDIYVCAPSLREMAALIARHMPTESISVADIAACHEKGWGGMARFIKPEPGVWASRHPKGPIILHMSNGVATDTEI